MKRRNKKLWLSLITFICLAIGGIFFNDTTSSKPGDLEKVYVVRVIDGDTIVVKRQNSKNEKIRFIGVNTPEIGQKGYKQATDFTKDLLLKKTVYLEKDVSNRDKYGRLLRYVWLENKTDDYQNKTINHLLKTNGLAKDMWMKPNLKYKSLK